MKYRIALRINTSNIRHIEVTAPDRSTAIKTAIAFTEDECTFVDEVVYCREISAE